MATNVTVTSQYSGDLAKEIMIQAFKASETIEKGLVTPLTNVVGTGIMPKLSLSITNQANACGWDPQGDVTYVDKEITTKRLMSQMEICKKDFANTFQAKAQGFGANSEIPTDIKTAILEAYVLAQGQNLDNMIWNGATGSSSQFPGFFPLFDADSDVVKVTGTVSTVANVEGELAKVVDLILPAIDEDENLVLLVSKNVFKNYKRYLRTLPNGHSMFNEKGEIDYSGIRLIGMSAFGADKIVAYRINNTAFATNLLSDINEVLIADDEARLDGKILMKTVWDGAVGFSFGNEIIYYRK